MGGNFIWRSVVACVALTAVCYQTVSGTSVAFSVAKTVKQILDPNDLVVTYQKEFVNVGGAFDLNTNTFTCPTAGEYAFHFHGLTERPRNYFLIGLYHNDQPTVRAHGKATENPEFVMGGNTVLLSLAVGDTVQVRFVTQYLIEQGLYGDDVDTYVTFSGYLL